MRVHSLNLTHFRNYGRLSLEFSPGKNLFLGNNGQGKTNLLEGLYFLSHARSHRTATDRELVQAGQPFATVSAQLSPHHYEGSKLLEAQVQLQGAQDNTRLKTVFKLSATPLKSRSEVLGHLPTVSFFLPDLLLLRGTPEDRRNWLDAAIVQYDKRHLYYLKDFQKIRQQKGRLLKEDPALISREHLAIWNTQFAHAGAKVIASRLDYLNMIEDYAAITYLELSDGQERLRMRYQSSALDILRQEKPSGGFLLEEIETVLHRQLETHQNDEIRRGMCLYGPHRDDIQFYLNEMEANAYGSQGQQRSVVLALKLTELKCLNAKLQEPPVLLLDDVMAELDPDRQRLLVEHIDPESQVMITTTHPTLSWMSLLKAHGAGHEIKAWQVTAGHIGPYGGPAEKDDSAVVSTSPVENPLSGREGGGPDGF